MHPAASDLHRGRGNPHPPALSILGPENPVQALCRRGTAPFRIAVVAYEQYDALLILSRWLTGQLTEHHAWLIQGALAHIALLDRQITNRDQHIGELMAPRAPQNDLVILSPGLSRTA